MSKTKEYYAYYKERGICVRCKKAKAHPGKVQCLDCLEKIATYQRQRYANGVTEDKRKRNTEYLKRKKQLCVAFGVCVHCLQKDAKKGQVCLECYVKIKKRREAKRQESEKPPRALWGEMNLCSLCGEPVEEGKRLCPKHLNMWRGIAKRGRDSRNLSNHKWTRDTALLYRKSQYLNK